MIDWSTVYEVRACTNCEHQQVFPSVVRDFWTGEVVDRRDMVTCGVGRSLFYTAGNCPAFNARGAG